MTVEEIERRILLKRQLIAITMQEIAELEAKKESPSGEGQGGSKLSVLDD